MGITVLTSQMRRLRHRQKKKKSKQKQQLPPQVPEGNKKQMPLAVGEVAVPVPSDDAPQPPGDRFLHTQHLQPKGVGPVQILVLFRIITISGVPTEHQALCEGLPYLSSYLAA